MFELETDIIPLYRKRNGLTFFWRRCTIHEHNKVHFVVANHQFLIDMNHLERFNSVLSKLIAQYDTAEFKSEDLSWYTFIPPTLKLLLPGFSKPLLEEIQELSAGTIHFLNFNKTVNKIINGDKNS